MDNRAYDHLVPSGADMMIESARGFLKVLAADGQDAYLDRIWEMRDRGQTDAYHASNTGWPIQPADAFCEGTFNYAPWAKWRIVS